VLKLDPTNDDSLLVASCLLMVNNRGEEASVYLRGLNEEDPTNTLYNTLLSTLYSDILDDAFLG